MLRSRLALRAFGLCTLVLGLTAFAAGTAQAETGATWRVNGAAIPGAGDLLPQLVVKEVENKSASISFTTAGGTSVLFLCTATEFDTGGVLISNGGVSTGNVSFKGCVTLLNEVASPKCTPHSPGKPAGEILSLQGRGLIALDKLPSGELTELVKVLPINAKGEVTKLFGNLEMGESCAIGELVNVETTELGEGVWGKDIGGNAGFLTESVTHLMVEALKKLLVLGRPAIVIGSTVVELSGAHKGLKWSGVPG
jgi:hypothetical protein